MGFGLVGRQIDRLALDDAQADLVAISDSAGLGIANFPFGGRQGLLALGGPPRCDGDVEGGVDSIWQSDRLIEAGP